MIFFVKMMIFVITQIFHISDIFPENQSIFVKLSARQFHEIFPISLKRISSTNQRRSYDWMRVPSPISCFFRAKYSAQSYRAKKKNWIKIGVKMAKLAKLHWLLISRNFSDHYQIKISDKYVASLNTITISLHYIYQIS